MNITVVGVGYVGLSLALLLSSVHNVVAVDTDSKRVEHLNNKEIYFDDQEMKNYIKDKTLNLRAIKNLDEKEILSTDCIIICVGTDYDELSESLDTKIIDTILRTISVVNKKTMVIIRSTIPIGYTKQAREKFGIDDLFFSPEFLREGSALHDCMNPDRIIIGIPKGRDSHGEKITLLVNMFEKITLSNPTVMIVDSDEAEAIKLFSNAYLAMRISFFNEIDTFSISKKLNTSNIIRGICLDGRIGNEYNNSSFGYGGYCLPKDTKQLMHQFKEIPNDIIRAIVMSNDTRKEFIANEILAFNAKTIGIYRLTAKKGSDNIRNAAVIEIIEIIKKETNKVIIFEPLLKEETFCNIIVVNDINKFIEQSDLIVANRIDNELERVSEKVYTRDLFGKN